MSRYTERDPLTAATTSADGTLTAAVDALGPNTHYMPRTGRFPAFIGLAKATGGLYVENTQGTLDPEGMLADAGLDFTVDFGAVQTTVIDADGVETLTSDTRRATVATWPARPDRPARRSILGVVGNDYTIMQNQTIRDLGVAFASETGAGGVAAGAYGNPIGSRVYLAFKLPEGLDIGGDRHDLYMTFGTSHDGGTSLWGTLAPIRLACTNQVSATFGRLANKFVIRHTGDMAGKLKAVHDVLVHNDAWTARWRSACDTMLETRLSSGDVDKFLTTLMPTPASVRTEHGARVWEDRRAAIASLARSADTCQFGRGTAYSLYQAVAEWADHVRPARGDNPDRVRYARIIDGAEAGEHYKDRAAQLLLAGR